jgi:hypothetical protein
MAQSVFPEVVATSQFTSGAVTISAADNNYVTTGTFPAGVYTLTATAPAGYSPTVSITATNASVSAGLDNFVASSVASLVANMYIESGTGLPANASLSQITHFNGTTTYFYPYRNVAGTAVSGAAVLAHKVFYQAHNGTTLVASGYTTGATATFVLSQSCNKITLWSSSIPAGSTLSATFVLSSTILSATNFSGATVDTITASGNYNLTGSAYVLCVGGGQGGGNSSSNNGYGGSGGSAGELKGGAFALSGTYAVTIGAAGVGNNSRDTLGNAGGVTNFGNLVSAAGGSESAYTGIKGGGSGGNSWAGYPGQVQPNPLKSVKSGNNGSGAGGSGGAGLGPSNAPGGSGIGTGGVGGNQAAGGAASGYGGGGGGAGHNYGNPGGSGTQGVIYVVRGF